MGQQSTVELQCDVIAVVDKVLAAGRADRWCIGSRNAAVEEIVLVVDGVSARRQQSSSERLASDDCDSPKHIPSRHR